MALPKIDSPVYDIQLNQGVPDVGTKLYYDDCGCTPVMDGYYSTQGEYIENDNDKTRYRITHEVSPINNLDVYKIYEIDESSEPKLVRSANGLDFFRREKYTVLNTTGGKSKTRKSRKNKKF